MDFEKYLPTEYSAWIKGCCDSATDITLIKGSCIFASCHGRIIDSHLEVTEEILKGIIDRMCNGSIYAHQNTLKEGYITLPSGHRVGVSGTVVSSVGDLAQGMSDITAINIRIARSIHGAAKEIIEHLITGNRALNTLIIAPPSAGKTTVLKDIAFRLGESFRIGIVDEREELGEGLGRHCFTIKGTSKAEGILMLLRSMAPQIIITDEIGTDDDERAIEKLLNAGVKIICTAHAFDENDIISRATFRRLIAKSSFERLIVLSDRNGPGTIEKILDTKELSIIA